MTSPTKAAELAEKLEADLNRDNWSTVIIGKEVAREAAALLRASEGRVPEDTLRTLFEAHMSDNGKWANATMKAPNGGYLLLRTAVAWEDWKACAAVLTAAPHPPSANTAPLWMLLTGDDVALLIEKHRAYCSKDTETFKNEAIGDLLREAFELVGARTGASPASPALAIEMLVAAGHVTREKADEALRLAGATPPAQQAEPTDGYLVETEKGPMYWPADQSGLEEARTYCDDDEEPVELIRRPHKAEPQKGGV